MKTDYTNGLTLAAASAKLEELLALESELRALLGANTPRDGRSWTRQEELGHLCDSAFNNIWRFVRLQIPAHLANGVLHAPGYAQDEWVKVQAYAMRPWEEVVALWATLNHQALHLLRTVNPASLAHTWAIGDTHPSLEHLMLDYVGHQAHHLGNIVERDLTKGLHP